MAESSTQWLHDSRARRSVRRIRVAKLILALALAVLATVVLVCLA